MKQVGHLKRVYGEMCKVDRDWEIFKDIDMDIIVRNLVYGIKIPSWNAFMGVLKMYTSYEIQSKSGRRWN